MPASEHHTLVVGSGPQPASEELFRGVRLITPVLLVDQATPTWQWTYLADYEAAALDDPRMLRRAGLRLAANYSIATVLPGSEAAVPAAAELAALLTGELPQDLCSADPELQTALHRASLPTLSTVPVDTPAQAAGAARRIEFPVVLKRPPGPGGAQPVVARSVREVPAAFRTVAADLPPGSHVLVQELADGPEVELLCATTDNNTRVLAALRIRLLGSPGERSGATGDPADPLLGAMASTATRVLAGLDARTGLSTLTLRLAPTGPRVIIAHTHTPFDRGPLWRALTGIDLGVATAALAYDHPLATAQQGAPQFVAERVLRAPVDGVLAEAHLAAGPGQPEASAVQWHAQVGDTLSRGTRVCTLTARAADPTACQQGLDAASTAVRFHLDPPPP